MRYRPANDDFEDDGASFRVRRAAQLARMTTRSSYRNLPAFRLVRAMLWAPAICVAVFVICVLFAIFATLAGAATQPLPAGSALSANTILCGSLTDLENVGKPPMKTPTCLNTPGAAIVAVLEARSFAEPDESPCQRMAFRVTARIEIADRSTTQRGPWTGWVPGSHVLPQLCDWSQAKGAPPKPRLNPVWDRYLAASGILLRR